MDSRSDAPIACTLQSASYHERLAWIAQLAHDGLVGMSRNDLQIELTYASSVAGRVREMVSKEQECCAFLNFEVSETGEDVRLTITAPERAREVADSLFEPFVPAGFPRSASVLHGGTEAGTADAEFESTIVDGRRPRQ